MAEHTETKAEKDQQKVDDRRDKAQHAAEDKAKADQLKQSDERLRVSDDRINTRVGRGDTRAFAACVRCGYELEPDDQGVTGAGYEIDPITNKKMHRIDRCFELVNTELSLRWRPVEARFDADDSNQRQSAAFSKGLGERGPAFHPDPSRRPEGQNTRAELTGDERRAARNAGENLNDPEFKPRDHVDAKKAEEERQGGQETRSGSKKNEESQR